MFVLTPRFAPVFQASQSSPFGACSPVSQPAYSYRVSRPQPRLPQYSSFNSLFSQVDELLSEIDREAQRQAQLEAYLEAKREAHRQRQQRKRTLRAKFAISQNEQGWQVEGDIQGFEQENINIDVIDEHTLKVTGNTRWQSEKPQTETQQAAQEAALFSEGSTEQPQINGEAEAKAKAGTPSEVETATVSSASPDTDTDSDTHSHKSYQPTVEDDYEDLGAETSSLLSASSGTSTSADMSVKDAEPKGKEKAVEEPIATESAVSQQPQPQPQPEESAKQPHSEEQQRVHGTFVRTFRFPERIDAANVSASFKDGVLRINVPRAQISQTRRIAIL